MRLTTLLCLVLAFSFAKTTCAQNVARVWNEELLEAIRSDFARPTVHARNLYHTSMAMYDAWAVFEDDADTHFLGKTTGTYVCALQPFTRPADITTARETAMSFAAYRVLRYRFRQSPSRSRTWFRLDSVMNDLGYNSRFTGTNYQDGDAAALGNYIGSQIIAYGMGDGSNDPADYINEYYTPINLPLVMDEPGNPDIIDPNRWQPLSLSTFIDQSGNPIPGGQQEFLGPEWGNVVPFAMSPAESVVKTRDGEDYRVYLDPGPPPYITDPARREEYQRGFEMVAIWGGLLDPADGTTIDISPGAIGRHADPLPTIPGYYDYYDEFGGGDSTGGLAINPATQLPYPPNIVKRGDYGRVLAEFWADGPDSETPPGHWFTLLNYVMDQPQFTTRWRGMGNNLDSMEYTVKAYLALGGAMHDAAIATWSIKGFYDYLRPVSAIRYMAEKGQRSDPSLPRYHEHGLRLEPGFIEFVDNISDPLAGSAGQNIGEIKLFTWKGPDFIRDPDVDVAGTGWILAKNWWPYQRPTFVSPPFAGYVSGHSTYSRAAAEVMTEITGSAYFPGGVGTFVAPKNEFLVFEEGPSETIELQWATYRDASDEVSLSRIFGGIHPPADDIPGRRIGLIVADDAIRKAYTRFDTVKPQLTVLTAFPVRYADLNTSVDINLIFTEAMDTTVAPVIDLAATGFAVTAGPLTWTNTSAATLALNIGSQEVQSVTTSLSISGLEDIYGNSVRYNSQVVLQGDTRRPQVEATSSDDFITSDDVGAEALTVSLAFDEDIDQGSFTWALPASVPSGVLVVNSEGWRDSRNYEIVFDVASIDANVEDVALTLVATDSFGNPLVDATTSPLFDLEIISSSIQVLADGTTCELFPNPATELVQLRFSESLTGRASLKVSNVMGQQVLDAAVTGFGESLDVGTLPRGTYLATLTRDEQTISWTLILQ